VHLPKPVRDLVAIPLQHDTVDEISQPSDLDWMAGECEPIPGKTMPKFRVVERDYTQLYEQMVTLGPAVEENGVAMHGLAIPVADEYRALAAAQGRTFNGQTRPSLEEPLEVVDTILRLDPVTNGELAYRAFEQEEHKTGRSLTHLAAGTRSVRYSFADLVAQPRRVLTSPTWSASINDGRAYSPFTLNVEELIPWRTLTGRQHFYLDHENYLQWGEHLPTYKPRPDHTMLDETQNTQAEAQGRLMNYITPHGKWSIHSTYSDNLRMMTLSRGDYPIWLNHKDAAALGIEDNDWVELFNDNGVFVQRCAISSRIPEGTVFVYHATERTISVPKSPLRGKRAGMNNSMTRTRLKPLLMAGGYGQFTYAFNYWGPTGVNRDTNVFVKKVEKVEF
jgi:nitrate reductase alpha subunit